MDQLIDQRYETWGVIFDSNLFDPIKNTTPWRNKPEGGLWASVIQSKDNWMHWLRTHEGVPIPSFKTEFNLRPDCQILQIVNSKQYQEVTELFKADGDVQVPTDISIVDYAELISEGEEPTDFAALDFEKMRSAGIDALFVAPLTEKGWKAPFHSWDCTTLLVLNEECVTDLTFFVDGERLELNAVEACLLARYTYVRKKIHEYAMFQENQQRLKQLNIDLEEEL